VPPKTTQEVPVYCVEHGRWTVQTSEFATARALAHGELRGQASYASQQDVWKEVAKKNEKRKIANSTGTYRNVAESETSGSLEKMEKQVDGALDKLPSDQKDKLVGFAVAINGKVATVDVFESHALFAKLQDKLVRSYLTEAVDVTADKNLAPPAPAAVKTFMEDSDKAKDEEDSYETKAAHTAVKKGRFSAKAKVSVDKKPDAPAVYENYQAH